MSVDGGNEIPYHPLSRADLEVQSSEFQLLYISAFQNYIHLRAQAPVHEASLLERHPPLARFARSISVQFFNEPRSEFLADLYQILAKVVYIA
jgi:hypothetical protein